MMWRIAILSAAGAALLGCRTDPNVSILERELRLQEDKIYQLEGQLADNRAALDACRRQAGAPGAGAVRGGAQGQSGPALAPAGPADAVTQPPVIELPNTPQNELPESLRSKTPAPTFEAPKFTPGTAEPKPAAPSGAAPARPGAATNRTRAKPVSAPAVAAPQSGAKSAARAEAASSAPVRAASTGRVERIVLNPSLSGGLNADGKPGDEGITLLIEPQDSQGRTLARAAPVSVVVLDSAARGDAARVARWDFSAEQVAQRFRRTSAGSGIYLELPWPVQAPAHSELKVFVRYAPDDSRRLEAELPVTIELPGQPRQWTTAQPGTRRSRPSEQPPPEPAPVAAKPATAKPLPIAEAAPIAPRASKASPEPAVTPQVRRPVWSPSR